MIGTGAPTAKDKLKDMLETQGMLIALIRQYTFQLNHHDEIIADFDGQINTLENQRKQAITNFQNAPEQIVSLNRQLTDLQAKRLSLKDITTGKAQKINRFKALKEKLEILKAELKAEGIDPDSGLKVN